MTERTEKCTGCVKEDATRVPIIRIITLLDEFFAKNDLSGARELLEHWQREAYAMCDRKGLLEVLNELIGLYRRTGERDKGLSVVADALDILDSGEFPLSVATETVRINAATTMKAFGKAPEAIKHYKQAEVSFEVLRADAFRRAALYNNMASAYAELKEFGTAESCYFKAMEILREKGENLGEVAVSLVNLAHMYHDKGGSDGRVEECLSEAWELLCSEEIPHDANYAFICSKCALAYEFFGLCDEAQALYEVSEEIYEGN